MLENTLIVTLFGAPRSHPTYLFGNGINRTKNELFMESWGGLLEALNIEVAESRVKNISSPINKTNCPKEYPFVFDEITLRNNDPRYNNEQKARQLLSEYLLNVQPNDRYRDFAKLKAKDIITTNFDYRIERAIDQNWNRPPFKKTSEQKYSLHRYQIAAEQTIWHCHGEQGMKKSMMLGYRHYIDYAAEVRHEAKRLMRSTGIAHDDLKDSWAHRFFTTDICICGLGMGYTEYPMWWLLAYRERMLHVERKKIRNKINFLVLKKDHDQTQRNLFDALKTYQVNVVEIDGRDYDEFYKLILSNEWMNFATLI